MLERRWRSDGSGELQTTRWTAAQSLEICLSGGITTLAAALQWTKHCCTHSNLPRLALRMPLPGGLSPLCRDPCRPALSSELREWDGRDRAAMNPSRLQRRPQSIVQTAFHWSRGQQMELAETLGRGHFLHRSTPVVVNGAGLTWPEAWANEEAGRCACDWLQAGGLDVPRPGRPLCARPSAASTSCRGPALMRADLVVKATKAASSREKQDLSEATSDAVCSVHSGRLLHQRHLHQDIASQQACS
jgi:hypothetical protein